MSKQRLEAFTDGVIAIIITIMVLDMKVPQGSNIAALRSGLPVFLAYALSFANVGIFWNNHHHMLHITERINGMVLWANLFLLFWLSLAVFGAVRNSLDGRDAFRPYAHGGLRRGVGLVRDRVPSVGAIDHRLQWSKLKAGTRGGP